MCIRDRVYIPSGLPHGVSGVNGNITWLNVRWDTDWPADAPPGAGNFQGPGRGGARGGGQRAEGAAGGGGFPGPLEYGGSGEIFIPKERLDGYMRDMELKNVATLRMIEGGRYNVNIRRITAPSVEYHDITADTWVILKGGGCLLYTSDAADERSSVDLGGRR